MTKGRCIKLLGIIYLLLTALNPATAQHKTGELLLRFKNTANKKALVLRDSSYTNAFDESYQVTRLKYYISNINLYEKLNARAGKNVFLIDASGEDSISLQLPAGTYNRLHFVLGIDSILNCSGAQDGALDPLNGMFWTWNSGYVFFKLEGFSPASPADLHRIEQHIGGYREPFNTARKIELELKEPLVINVNGKQEINIMVNLDNYWQGINEIKIADHALVLIPGKLAKKSADNFAAMFSLISTQ